MSKNPTAWKCSSSGVSAFFGIRVANTGRRSSALATAKLVPFRAFRRNPRMGVAAVW